MDCRGSHILCKEDTFLSMCFPVRPHRLDSAQWGTGLGSWEQTQEGATASCQPPCPHPWNPGGVGSFKGEARTAAGLENLQTFIFVLRGGKKERTLLEESLNYISVLGLFGRETTWRRVWETWVGWCLTIWATFWLIALSFCPRACRRGHFSQLRRFPGILSRHSAAAQGPSLWGWNRSFSSAPLEQRNPVGYFQTLRKLCPERWCRDNVMQTQLYSQFFTFYFFPNWAWMACGWN